MEWDSPTGLRSPGPGPTAVIMGKYGNVMGTRHEPSSSCYLHFFVMVGRVVGVSKLCCATTTEFGFVGWEILLFVYKWNDAQFPFCITMRRYFERLTCSIRSCKYTSEKIAIAVCELFTEFYDLCQSDNRAPETPKNTGIWHISHLCLGSCIMPCTIGNPYFSYFVCSSGSSKHCFQSSHQTMPININERERA